MNKGEHLTENQLNNYFGDALGREKKHEIGRHLLVCDFCLGRMPKPTPAQFWAAVMTDGDIAENSYPEKTYLSERLNFAAPLLKHPKVLVWSVGALAFCLIFSTFFWLSAAKSLESEREIAGSFELKNAPSVSGKNSRDKTDASASFPVSESSNSPVLDSARKISDRKPSVIRRNASQRITKSTSGKNSDTNLEENLPEKETVSIASSRGSSLTPCAGQSPVVAAVELKNKTIVLKWKAVPNAANYHLYISDDEEILIDEFETGRETSYVLKKPLVPQKIYQWKVVITLENGNTLIGDSRKFTVDNVLQIQNKSEKKQRSQIRCSAGKSKE